MELTVLGTYYHFTEHSARGHVDSSRDIQPAGHVRANRTHENTRTSKMPANIALVISLTWSQATPTRTCDKVTLRARVYRFTVDRCGCCRSRSRVMVAARALRKCPINVQHQQAPPASPHESDDPEPDPTPDDQSCRRDRETRNGMVASSPIYREHCAVGPEHCPRTL